MKKKRVSKPYWEMNAQELAEATAEFDREFVADTCTPLTPEMKARWEAAKRKGTGSKRGKGWTVISVRIEMDVLARSDALAKKMGISRAWSSPRP